jgi:phage terminase large subunit
MGSVKLSNVFHRNAQAYKNAVLGNGPRLIINQGGQGSSKTYSILQVIYNALYGSDTRIRATLCSYALPHLKDGALSDFDNILTSFNEDIYSIKSSPSQPTYSINKSIVNCFGIEGNQAKAHGPRRDILFVNECNRKVTYEVFDQLFSRSKMTFLDFNPDQEFWLHDKVLPNFPHVLIKSNFMDNPYLPESERQNILMKKDKPGFENWWKVYGLGELGKLEGAIFTNWRYGDFDTSLPYGYGLDFGYNAPDAMVKVAVDHKKMRCYWDERIYNNGLSFEQLRLLIGQSCSRNDLIVADSADARMIGQLRKYYNIKPTNKVKWTVAEGIKMMQAYEHIVTEGSINLAKEFNNYLWNDKKSGIPIDAFNHLIDAGRYKFLDTITNILSSQKWHG